MMLMLEVSEFFREEPGVMVIDQRHGPHNRSIGRADRSPDQPVPYQVAERLGSAVVALFRDEFVKPIK